MFSEYIQAALERAEFDTLEDGSYAATVPGLQGVIAIGNTFEECRKDLIEVIEEWIVARIQWGYPIPPIADHTYETNTCERSRPKGRGFYRFCEQTASPV